MGTKKVYEVLFNHGAHSGVGNVDTIWNVVACSIVEATKATYDAATKGHAYKNVEIQKVRLLFKVDVEA